MTITEPMTMITDYILAVMGAGFGIRLLQTARGRGSARQLWAVGFLTAAAAAAIGGTYHGFALYFDPPVLRALWNTTVGLIGAGAAFMISGALSSPLGRELPGTLRLKQGLALTLAGLAIQQSGFAMHRHFNHNDLYHLVQAAALYLLFRGAAANNPVQAGAGPGKPAAVSAVRRRS